MTKADIVSIEGEKNIYHLAKENLDYDNTHLINIDIDKYFINQNKKYDCIIIDANHTYEATLRYFEISLKTLNEGGVIIFDDIYWSSEMTRAWKKIIKKKKIHISIDFFKSGLIFSFSKSMCPDSSRGAGFIRQNSLSQPWSKPLRW